MSARDAAVRAVAEALEVWYAAVRAKPPIHGLTMDAGVAVHALATSADVRAGLVAAYDERMPCLVYPEDWQCGDGGNLSDEDHPRHAECVVAHLLAALGGAE